MSIKQITPTLIIALFLIGCGTEVQRETSQQVDISAHQVDMKIKTLREVAPEDKDYLNYMKIYNLNSLSFSLKKSEGAWSVNYNGSYDGKKAYYLDVDKNNQTGYYSKWTPKVGAEYLLEDGVLFKYTGADGTNEWSWDVVSYRDMRDFDHNVDSILAYGITLNDDWSYNNFLGYYDTDIPYKERDARFVRSEGEPSRHGAFYTAEDSEDFYIRALNKNYKQKENTKHYIYKFNINGTSYLVEGNTLFDASENITAENLLYELHEDNSIVIIPKKFLVTGDIKLEKAVIRDANWVALNSYEYEENQSPKVTREELISMILNDEDYSQVDVSGIADMSGLFASKEVKYDITSWDVSNVTDMSGMFWESELFNQPIGNWDVSNVTDMGGMFGMAKSFNQPIGGWDVPNVTDMSGMFGYANSFNQSIGDWDVSKVTDMNSMFLGAVFNQPIENWDVSKVTNMNNMFHRAYKFNQPIGVWSVSNVADMSWMFASAKSFNQPLRAWNVSEVNDMGNMFTNAKVFNQSIGNWNVSKVTNMISMFAGTESFNQPIENWDVSNVTNMSSMFDGTKVFNQPLGAWDVSYVNKMARMFDGAKSFNQPLGNWDVSKVIYFYSFNRNSSLEDKNIPNFLQNQ